MPLDTADSVVEQMTALLERSRDDPFVRRRFSRNVLGNREPVTMSTFWHVLIACLVSTQQKSGPRSAANRFLTAEPFPLSWEACQREDLDAFAQRVLETTGLRFQSKIARQVVANATRLQEYGRTLLDSLGLLNEGHQAATERRVARSLADSLVGIGPKQSRNLLQRLGLSLYEIPLDSRVATWLTQYAPEIQVDRSRLSQRRYYDEISDRIIEACSMAGVLPCIFDAAVFAESDRSRGETNEDSFW